MKCLECENRFFYRIDCPNCGNIREEFTNTEKLINSFGGFDQKIRTLVRGLLIQGISLEASDEGGPGHLKPYPWVELGGNNEDQIRKLKRLVESFGLFYGNKYGYWYIEKKIGDVLWISPMNKNLSIEILHKSAEELGWYLHQIRL